MSSQHEISEYINNLPLQKTLCKGFRPDDVYDVICNISSMYNQLLSEVYKENEELKRKIEGMEMENRFAKRQTVEPVEMATFWGMKNEEPEVQVEMTKDTSSRDKELQRLKRGELLEILLEQSKENEALRLQMETKDKEIEALSRQLENRRIEIKNAGSIAEASLKLNGVFESAEQAAQQYLENLQELYEREEKEIEARCAVLIQSTKQQCEYMQEDVLQKCENMEASIRRKCENMLQATEEKCKAREMEFEAELEEKRRAAAQRGFYRPEPAKVEPVQNIPAKEEQPAKSDIDRRWEELSKRLESFYVTSKV